MKYNIKKITDNAYAIASLEHAISVMVELLIESEFHKKYKTFVPKKYSIVKVKSHITADEAEQMNLF